MTSLRELQCPPVLEHHFDAFLSSTLHVKWLLTDVPDHCSGTASAGCLYKLRAVLFNFFVVVVRLQFARSC